MPIKRTRSCAAADRRRRSCRRRRFAPRLHRRSAPPRRDARESHAGDEAQTRTGIASTSRTPPFYPEGVTTRLAAGWGGFSSGPGRECVDRLEPHVPVRRRVPAQRPRRRRRGGLRVVPARGSGRHGRARTAATAARAATCGSSPITTWRRCWRFRDHPHRRADSGVHGKGKDLHGRRGESLEVKVPEGTVVKDLYSGEVLAELLPPRRPVPGRRRRAWRARQRQVPQQPAARADASPSRASTARSGGSSSSSSSWPTSRSSASRTPARAR